VNQTNSVLGILTNKDTKIISSTKGANDSSKLDYLGLTHTWECW